MGTVAVIVARDRGHARRILTKTLKEHRRPWKVEGALEGFKKIEMDEAQATVLVGY